VFLVLALVVFRLKAEATGAVEQAGVWAIGGGLVGEQVSISIDLELTRKAAPGLSSKE
jgi:hypothetical protein